MENDKGAYFLLIVQEGMAQIATEYDNAEAARKAAKLNEQTNPDGFRHIYKMLPGNEPIEIMP